MHPRVGVHRLFVSSGSNCQSIGVRNLSRDAAFEDFDEDEMVIVFHSRDDCAPLFRAAARIAVASSL